VASQRVMIKLITATLQTGTLSQPSSHQGECPQAVEVAYLLGFGANDPILMPTVQGLNKLRNQIAHTFELDRKALDEILRLYNEDYETFSVKDDRDRIKYLRWICRFICGRVAGEMLGA
jgi:hypothetical protein